MICVGEYFEQEHKVLISSRPLIELSDEILYVIDADVRAEIDSKKYDIMWNNNYKQINVYFIFKL